MGLADTPPDAEVTVHLTLAAAATLRGPSGAFVALGPRDAALLAWLAIEGPTPRIKLAGLLWPEHELGAARNNLRQRLFKLRKLAGAEVVGGGAMLQLAPHVEHDLGDAEGLLAGVPDDDGGEFSIWLNRQRERRRERVQHALIELIEMAEAAKDYADALVHAKELLALEPLSEDAHRRVIRLHYLNGDRAAALLAFDACERVLKDEVGTSPSAQTLALLGVLEAAASDAAPARACAVPAGVLRPPRMVGRDAELAAVNAAWQDGQVVLVLGEAGMGKSRLLSECADTTTSLAVARPGDAAVPFAAAARLLRAVIAQHPAAASAESRSRLATLLPEYAEHDAVPAANLAKLVQVVQGVLLAAQATGLHTVLLDDLHFADAATFDLLRELLGGNPTALRWGFAQRPAEGSQVTQAFADELEGELRLRRVALGSLDAAAMAALVDSLGVPQLDGARLAPALVRHTGGNPLFALETLKAMLVGGGGRWAGTALAVRDGVSSQLPAPTSVGALIGQRLKQLSPRALALARVAAVAGADFSAALAERILVTPAVELADAWAELEAAQVLRDAAFAHDLVYEATLAGVPAAIARELHARVADDLQAGNAPAERVASHRLEASDPHKSIPALRAAAAAAIAKFQRPLAARWLEQAADLLEQIGDRPGAFEVLAEAVQLRQGFDTGASHDAATQRLLALADTPSQRAEAATHRAVYLHIVGQGSQALPLIEQGLSAARSAHDDVALMRGLNVQGIVLRHVGRNEEAMRSLRDALALARTVSTDRGDELPAVLNNLALAQMEADDQVGAILHFEEAARLQPDAPTRARVLNNLALALEEIGSLERALDARTTAQRLLRGQDGTEFALLNLTVSLVGLGRYLLHFADALEWMAQAQAMAAPMTHWRTHDLHLQRALLYTDLGAWREADDAFAQIDLSKQTALSHLSVLLGRLHYLFARNIDATEALAQAEQLIPGGDRRRMRRLHLAKTRVLPPPQALALAAAELEREAAIGNRAAQIPFATLAARACLRQGDATAALRFAQRATDCMKAAQPASFSPFEVRFTMYEALLANGDARAQEEILSLASDLHEVATTQVPQEFRGTFLQGVALNRAIRAAAGGQRLVRR
ncbi:putative transcriptional regulator [Burkholderiales bacterium JOSHI_001]|nr:putative transcriptional regulator [Burkholderiales bacterium JOSHI_001]